MAAAEGGRGGGGGGGRRQRRGHGTGRVGGRRAAAAPDAQAVGARHPARGRAGSPQAWVWAHSSRRRALRDRADPISQVKIEDSDEHRRCGDRSPPARAGRADCGAGPRGCEPPARTGTARATARWSARSAAFFGKLDAAAKSERAGGTGAAAQAAAADEDATANDLKRARRGTARFRGCSSGCGALAAAASRSRCWRLRRRRRLERPRRRAQRRPSSFHEVGAAVAPRAGGVRAGSRNWRARGGRSCAQSAPALRANARPEARVRAAEEGGRGVDRRRRAWAPERHTRAARECVSEALRAASGASGDQLRKSLAADTAQRRARRPYVKGARGKFVGATRNWRRHAARRCASGRRGCVRSWPSRRKIRNCWTLSSAPRPPRARTSCPSRRVERLLAAGMLLPAPAPVEPGTPRAAPRARGTPPRRATTRTQRQQLVVWGAHGTRTR